MYSKNCERAFCNRTCSNILNIIQKNREGRDHLKNLEEDGRMIVNRYSNSVVNLWAPQVGTEEAIVL
jgi:hypothetical protein